jgi:hypothetical protein
VNRNTSAQAIDRAATAEAFGDQAKTAFLLALWVANLSLFIYYFVHLGWLHLLG